MAYYRFFLVFFLSLSTSLPSYGVEKKQNQKLFQNHHAKTLNQFSTTHDFSEYILKQNPKNKSFLNETKRISKNPPIKMPHFKVQEEILLFNFNGENYSLKHLKGPLFSLNGKTLDIRSLKWDKNTTNLSPLYLKPFIDSAHAIAPIVYWAIYGIVFTVAMVCGTSVISSSKPSSGPKFVSSRAFNKSLNEIRRQVKLACGAAHADSLSDFLDYSTYFKNYCGSLAQRAIQRRTDSGVLPGPYNRDGSINSQFVRNVRYNGESYGIGNFDPERAENTSINSCSDIECTQVSTNSIPFNQLNSSDQNIIKDFSQNREFMSGCVEEALLSPGQQPTNGITKESTEGDQSTTAQ